MMLEMYGEHPVIASLRTDTAGRDLHPLRLSDYISDPKFYGTRAFLDGLSDACSVAARGPFQNISSMPIPSSAATTALTLSAVLEASDHNHLPWTVFAYRPRGWRRGACPLTSTARNACTADGRCNKFPRWPGGDLTLLLVLPRR